MNRTETTQILLEALLPLWRLRLQVTEQVNRGSAEKHDSRGALKHPASMWPAECRPSLETGGKRRFSFSACQWTSKDSMLSLSLALSLEQLRTRPDLPDNNIL